MLAALMLAGALAACGGTGEESSSGTADLPGSNQERGGTTGGGPGGSPNRATNNQARLAPRAVVYTAQLSVRAPNVDQAAARAKQMAVAAGGYVQEEASDHGTHSRVTLKIPSGRYAAVLAELSGKLGTRLSLRQQTQDVTGETADVASRVKSAQASLDSFRKLLDRAASLEQIMSLEEEIARRQADLEALQARQKALQESTQYATVTVTLTGPPAKAAPEPEEEPPGGFLTGLKSGWDAFTVMLAVVTTVVGWLLPFLGLAALIGVPVLLVWRRTRSRRTSLPK